MVSKIQSSDRRVEVRQQDRAFIPVLTGLIVEDGDRTTARREILRSEFRYGSYEEARAMALVFAEDNKVPYWPAVSKKFEGAVTYVYRDGSKVTQDEKIQAETKDEAADRLLERAMSRSKVESGPGPQANPVIEIHVPPTLREIQGTPTVFLTAHQLAQKLLDGPDLPVLTYDQDASEYVPVEAPTVETRPTEVPDMHSPTGMRAFRHPAAMPQEYVFLGDGEYGDEDEYEEK